MKFSKNKTVATLVALLLMLTIAIPFFALPTANAHTPAWQVPTYAYVSANPTPIGVGQEVTVVFWINWVPPTAAGMAGDRWFFYLDITKPDGTKQTVGPLTSDPVGGSYYIFAPDAAGNYTITARFGPQVITGSNGTGIPNVVDMFGNPSPSINDNYLASSATTTLTVQEEPIASPPIYPLPTEYWTRPIEGQNTEWYAIASNWLGSPQIANRLQPDGTAPNSAHVMWTKPLEDGGVVGGTNTGTNGMTYYDGTAYEGKMGSVIIMNGRLYYPLPRSNDGSGGGYVCADLRTGEKIYYQNMTTPTFGQLFDYESINQHGVIPNGYVWTTDENPFAAFFGGPVGPITWSAYDSLTGNWLFSETGIPSGTDAYGPNGELLRYVLDANNHWLALWNNTAVQALTAAFDPNDYTSSNYYQWRPVGKTVDASKAYSWNVTIPALPAGSSIISVIPDDLILGGSPLAGFGASGTPDPYTMWAISLKPSSRGQLLWMKDYAAPAGNITVEQGPVDPVNRVFVMYQKETIRYLGYSIDDGSLLWGPTASENPFNFYSDVGIPRYTVAYGKLYSTQYSGTVYCYDTKSGSLLWNYTASAGLAAPYPGYPLGIGAIADGKLYLYTTEHSANAPHWVGVKMRCINATTGKEIWTIAGYGSQGAMAEADGYLTYLNNYDMQIYTIGKGPSATTVEAPMTAITTKDTLVIRGTVTDIAAGTKQNEQAARFPNGVPAVSDESESAWMEYVYAQKPKPTNATGVPVSIDAIDPNNNFVHLGDTHSDSRGQYAFQVDPSMLAAGPGLYTVIASFAGSNSYYPSSAETVFAVTAATPTASPYPVVNLPPTEMYILGGVAAIIVAIAIVGVVLAMMIRKRPVVA